MRRPIIPEWLSAILLLFVLAGSPAPPVEGQDLVELVTMRDGTKLKAHVWFPEGSRPWPVVLQGRLTA